MTEQVLRFEGGPKDGDSYRVPSGMQPPLSIIRKDCPFGKYVLVKPDPKSVTQFAPFLRWVGK